MDSATKEDVGASASGAEDRVLLNSGHHMPLFGWGTAEVPDEAVLEATKSAIKLGYRVRYAHSSFSNAPKLAGLEDGIAIAKSAVQSIVNWIATST